MEMTVTAPDYRKLAVEGIERLKNSYRNKTGIEEIVDCEMGPDVRHVLSQNDIEMVKKFLMGPITPAEYRELRYKLIELQNQNVQPRDKNGHTGYDSSRSGTAGETGHSVNDSGISIMA